MSDPSATGGKTRIIVQLAGTMAALTGLYFCCRVWIQAGFNSWPLLLVLVVPFGSYFGYLGYVTWWRFTPGAIRHICGAIAFFLFFVTKVPFQTLSRKLSQNMAETEVRLETIEGALIILLFACLFWGYQRAWPFLVKAIFGEPREKV